MKGTSIMLVLSRKHQESVVVGGSAAAEPLLKVTVVEIKGDRVRLGFEADAAIPVHRWEVWERIRAGDRPGPLGADPPAEVV
jgi:carbon storage regulator